MIRSSKGIPTPTRACTHSRTRFMARSERATSATIFRRPICNGEARIRLSFCSMPRSSSAERGGRITNVDLTLICERPKIGPHREAMCARMAELLGIERERVSVKATTSEGLGFTGRKEGIAALATATVVFDAG